MKYQLFKIDNEISKDTPKPVDWSAVKNKNYNESFNRLSKQLSGYRQKTKKR